MRTNAISTLSLWNAPRTGVARMQAELARANEEVVTGRYADVGLQLGSRTGQTIGLRQKIAELAALRDGNGPTAMRLATAQAALKQIQSAADDTLKVLNGVPSNQRAALVKQAASTQLAAMTAALNTSVGGQFVFGGTNTGQPPVSGTAATAASASVDAALMARYGVPQANLVLGSITGGEMSAFLDNEFATQFDAAHWSAGWSSAGSQPLTSRISLTETVPSSASANAEPLRKLAMAYTLASALDLTKLSPDAQSVATDRIVGLLGEASGGLIGMQADLGRSEAAITDANTRLDSQKALITTRIGDMEGVDTAETKTRIDHLTTQIQISYALTSQLRQLSLVSYL
ncbi:flagellar hook-associated family protein [Methylobacterium sp. Leaf85]|uniref:flagellar hook-associated family protein n=1 Tax=Methylobacterium sp. Leaf85 TaxID=1736241 RepID=UPI0006FC90D6|nr:flagellar hook-associated family protein [Methylobacterium sp. Leaf85]KQO51578.1 flagellar biosynthesis protein FlgL [Methylobacterium sp. Leaf85]